MILSVAAEAPAPPGCTYYDEDVLARTGALALWTGAGGVRIETVAARAGHRPWVQP